MVNQFKRVICSMLLVSLLTCTIKTGAVSVDTNSSTAMAVSAGAFHSLLLREDGSVWSWGGDQFGQLGTGFVHNGGDDDIPTQTFPVRIMTGAKAVSAGNSHSLALKADGSVWAWGVNTTGAIGNGGVGNYIKENSYLNDVCQTTPVCVLTGATSIAAGTSTSFAIKEDGSLWGWGENRHGVLGNVNVGDGDIKDTKYHYQTTPIKIMDNVRYVAPWSSYVMAIKTDNTLWIWGDGESMGLDSVPPDDIKPTKIMDDVYSVCAAHSNFAIKNDKSLWAWGYNRDGQLGVVTEEIDVKSPRKIMDGVSAVSSYLDTTAIIKSDGTLWTVGSNFYGELGIGTSFYVKGNSSDPVGPSKVLDNVNSVCVGAEHMLAITSDNSVWAWGSNAYDQLGSNGEATYISNTGVFGFGFRSDNQVTPLKIWDGSMFAYPQEQIVYIDGKPITFYTCALKDENGNLTNYVKLRDVGYAFNGSASQFDIKWDGSIDIIWGSEYTPNGSEMTQTFTDVQPYVKNFAHIKMLGENIAFPPDGIVITDEAGGGHTYFNLRNLAKYLYFHVDWVEGKGIVIETGRKYNE